MSNCNNHNCSNSIYVSGSETRGAIQASNNKARYYAELAEKYKNEAKEMRDDAQYYAEQNSDVTKTYVDGIDSALRNLIATKQNSGNYALEDEIPTKLSELQNDTSYVNSTELENAVDSVLPSTTGKIGVLSFDGSDMDWEDVEGEILTQVTQSLSTKVNTDFSNASPSQTFKNTSMNWGLPNYSAGIDASISGTVSYTCPSNGFVIMSMANTSGNIRISINGVVIGYQAKLYYDVQFPVSKNDVIIRSTGSSSITLTFFPLKGGN